MIVGCGMMKENSNIAITSLAICTLMTSFSWMYMRIPEYYEKIFNVNSELTPWLLYAYIIAEVSVVITAGVMTDKLGAKNVTLLGLALFSGGSFGVCITDSIELMVIYRIIQGGGAGFLFTVGLAAVPKLFGKSDRLNSHKKLILGFSLGSIFGTSVGYYFTLTVGEWRYFFVIAGIVVIIFGFLAYVTIPNVTREHVRDAPGLILSITSIALLMTYTQMLGRSFDLISFESLAFFEACILSLVLLFYVEKRRKDPLIPHGLNKHNLGLLAGMFIVGFCGLGMLQFIALFLVVTYHFTIYQTTCMMLCLILGGAITSLIGMKMIYKVGIRPLSILGPIVVMIGLVAGYFLMVRGPFGVAVTLVILGMGFGCMITEMVLSLQATAQIRVAGAHTGMLVSTRFIGIIMGMAVYGGLVRTLLKDFIYDVEGKIPPDIINWLINHIFAYLDQIIVVFQDSIRMCCIIGAVAVLCATVVAYFFITKEDLDTPEFKE